MPSTKNILCNYCKTNGHTALTCPKAGNPFATDITHLKLMTTVNPDSWSLEETKEPKISIHDADEEFKHSKQRQRASQPEQYANQGQEADKPNVSSYDELLSTKREHTGTPPAQQQTATDLPNAGGYDEHFPSRISKPAKATTQPQNPALPEHDTTSIPAPTKTDEPLTNTSFDSEFKQVSDDEEHTSEMRSLRLQAEHIAQRRRPSVTSSALKHLENAREKQETDRISEAGSYREEDVIDPEVLPVEPQFRLKGGARLHLRGGSGGETNPHDGVVSCAEDLEDNFPGRKTGFVHSQGAEETWDLVDVAEVDEAETALEEWDGRHHVQERQVDPAVKNGLVTGDSLVAGDELRKNGEGR